MYIIFTLIPVIKFHFWILSNPTANTLVLEISYHMCEAIPSLSVFAYVLGFEFLYLNSILD